MWPDALFDLRKQKQRNPHCLQYYTLIDYVFKIQKKINQQDRRDFGHDRSKIDGGYIAVSSLSEVEKLHKCIWVYIIYSMCEISNPNLNLEPERIC